MHLVPASESLSLNHRRAYFRGTDFSMPKSPMISVAQVFVDHVAIELVLTFRIL